MSAPLPPAPRADAVVLVVGVGGLGCPAALALARAGARLLLADDDQVELSNLHRQILYGDADVGRDKLDAARGALLDAGAASVELARTRLLPETARELMLRADLVVEGSDNFATKFLAADAAHLTGRPIVHGAAVRWHGTAWAVGSEGRPCYRCLFEDILPDELAPGCDVAGVVGPAVGVVGALLADLALDLLAGERLRLGQVLSFDGKRVTLRAARIHPRADCPLCGTEPTLLELERARYLAPSCAAPSQRSAAAPAR
jgi:molybdopterin/thiamine biosynthesis adenylyltransferase